MEVIECRNNCSSMEILYEIVSDEVWRPWDTFSDYFEYQPWFFSLLGSVMVGLSGVFPLLVIPIEDGVNLKNGAGAGTLRLLLSFAVGGLLGDVFLHLLPEAWENESLKNKSEKGHTVNICGLWVLAGFLVFIIAEKMFPHSDEDDEEEENPLNECDITSETPHMNNNYFHEDRYLDNNNLVATSKYLHMELKMRNGLKNGLQNGLLTSQMCKNGTVEPENGFLSKNNVIEPQNGLCGLSNGILHLKNGALDVDNEKSLKKQALPLKNSGISGEKKSNGLFSENAFVSKASMDVQAPEMVKKPKAKHISGYLNLMANCIDNFTHGLAVGGSFLVSFRLGALTTFAILIHEIPHEVGDFAILLKSGFNRWDAARAQLITATGGIFGALIAVLCSGSGVESRTSWILPFTAGGFLHIGLVTVLPELLQEKDPKESIKQLGAFFVGITIMAALTILCD